MRDKLQVLSTSPWTQYQHLAEQELEANDQGYSQYRNGKYPNVNVRFMMTLIRLDLA